MRAALAFSIGLLVAGVALITLSVLLGGASVQLVVIFPVLSGSSALFLLGVLLLVVGFFSLPFGLAREWEGPAALPESGPVPAPGSSGVGGLVLVGPVPILFGSWKGVSRRTRWMLALVGAVLFTVALVALLWLAR